MGSAWRAVRRNRVSRYLGLLFAGLVAATGFPAPSAGQAPATTVHCGDVITQDTTLDSDLGPCPGDGLVIGASNVTLDLKGHTIRGPGTGTFPSAGIRADGDESHNLTGVQVKNGTVTAFSAGISLQYAGAAVNKMTLSGNDGGLFGTKLTTLDVENSVISRDGDGIDVIKGTLNGASYRDNVVTNNSGFGMVFTFASDGFTATGNVITGNGGAGLQLFKVGGPGEVSYNRISGNGFDGIEQSYCGGPIANNVISGNQGDGISRFVSTSGCPVSNNVISDNTGNGIRQYDTTLTADGNLITGNGENGVLVNEDSGFVPPTAYLIDNTASRNKLDGIHIGPDTGGFDHARTSMLQGNTTDRNGHDGISTESPNTAINGTHAWFNGNLGIEAVPGTSGTGNWAKHNGDPRQCVNVACSTTGKPK